MVEFELRGDLATIQNSIVDANFDELKAWLDSELAGYRNMVVTPDKINEAKSHRANIRKIASRIDEQRIAVKKAYSAPLNAFEAKCKELTSICANASNQIDQQIKAYEEAAKKEKEARLKAFYNSLEGIGEAVDMATWSDMLDPRWLNATYSEEKAKAELESKAKRMQDDITVIRGFDPEFTAPLLNYYSKSGFDLGATLKTGEIWRQARETERKTKAAAEAMKKQQEEAAKLKAELDALAEKAEQAKQNPKPAVTYGDNADTADVEYIVVEFAVKCTKEQLAELKAFLKANNIKYGPIRR